MLSSAIGLSPIITLEPSSEDATLAIVAVKIKRYISGSNYFNSARHTYLIHIVVECSLVCSAVLQLHPIVDLRALFPMA